ncbi:Putative inner membrane protein [Salmonella enterica subsp. enterica]|nr:Putative inner membrane protein [Salmonella enterica subsp. enterica]
MGLVIKAALGALVVVLIGLLSKTKNYYIAGLIPLFPTFCAYRALYRGQRAGHRRDAYHHRL